MHWRIFEDEKGETVEIGYVNFHQKSCFDKSLPKKGMGNKLLRKIQDVCYFNA